MTRDTLLISSVWHKKLLTHLFYSITPPGLSAVLVFLVPRLMRKLYDRFKKMLFLFRLFCLLLFTSSICLPILVLFSIEASDAFLFLWSILNFWVYSHANWCQLMPTDANWCQLMPTDANWCQLMPTDANWHNNSMSIVFGLWNVLLYSFTHFLYKIRNNDKGLRFVDHVGSHCCIVLYCIVLYCIVLYCI
jgi:hypothetical protein